LARQSEDPAESRLVSTPGELLPHGGREFIPERSIGPRSKHRAAPRTPCERALPQGALNRTGSGFHQRHCEYSGYFELRRQTNGEINLGHLENKRLAVAAANAYFHPITGERNVVSPIGAAGRASNALRYMQGWSTCVGLSGTGWTVFLLAGIAQKSWGARSIFSGGDIFPRPLCAPS
jgi:hypothetical protein